MILNCHRTGILLVSVKTDMNWFLSGVWEYICSTRDQVMDLQSCVQKAKNNVEEITKLMSTWSKQPLFERKEDKHDTLLNLDDRNDRLGKRYNEIKNIGDKIHKLLQVSISMKVEGEKISPGMIRLTIAHGGLAE